MKPLFIKKNGTVSKVSGIIMNLIPSYTLAEYNALTHKPLFWVRTDEEYAQIPSEDVSYGSGSVKDALDGVTKHSFGQDVDLSSYSNTSNIFTVPADGYIYVASTNLSSSSTDYRLDVWCGTFVLCSLSKDIQRITTFVRKGMRIYYTNYYYTMNTNCFIQYAPLT